MRRVSLLIGATLLGLSACGSDSEGGNVSDTSNPPDSSVASPSASGAVSSKEEARTAVVRIVSQGSFRDPEVGFQSGAGSGSGFIVSPDGLMVTNQHVVEGAGSVEVFIDGEDRPLNARILGVSECNDLAVLDLEGDGYPYFEWFEGNVEAGIAFVTGAVDAGHAVVDQHLVDIGGKAAEAHREVSRFAPIGGEEQGAVGRGVSGEIALAREAGRPVRRQCLVRQHGQHRQYREPRPLLAA